MRLCDIQGCERRHKGHGMCQTHLARIQRNGDLEKHYSKSHGMHDSPEYQVWVNMIQRCTNPKNNRYKHYGGRGITVCERWRKFENFYTDMGKRPNGLSIDRINNNGSYEPKNCRWATSSEQQLNKRPRTNKSGHKHIYTFSDTKRVMVQIKRGGEVIYRGMFDTLKEALISRDKTVKKLLEGGE